MSDLRGSYVQSRLSSEDGYLFATWTEPRGEVMAEWCVTGHSQHRLGRRAVCPLRWLRVCSFKVRRPRRPAPMHTARVRR